MNELIHLVLYLLVGLSFIYFVSGIDDLFIDAYAWLRGTGPRQLSDGELREMRLLPQRKIAIIIASWHESTVLGRMITGNIERIEYQNYDFFLGVYPNDTETLQEARRLARIFSNVHVVVNRYAGPTSKGQMINEIARGILAHERRYSTVYDAFIMHDSEDLIHPLSLTLSNAMLLKHDFVQIPIFSLPVPLTKWVAGTYQDEFSEYHTKDILVRNRMGVPIPSAGTGTALSRRLISAQMRAKAGDLLNERSLTEDYELGVTSGEHEAKSVFACFYLAGKSGSREYIATRAYFPKKFRQSIRQKTRWTIGIAFQGTANVGWRKYLRENYFLLRDRKGPLCNIAVVTGLVSAVFIFGASFSHPSGEASIFLLHGFLIKGVLGANSAFMLNRIFQRIYCTRRVYGNATASLAAFRIPLSNIINAGAALNAFGNYFMHKWTGTPLKWSKTDHELPDQFGTIGVEPMLPEPLPLRTPMSGLRLPQEEKQDEQVGR